MTGRLEEECYSTYRFPASHVYGMSKEGKTFFDHDWVEEKELEMVADHEHKTITLRSATGFKKEMITLPYSGFMAFRAMMEMAMDDLWQGMTEDDREKARFEFNRRKR